MVCGSQQNMQRHAEPKNLAFGILQRQKFLAYALTGETEMRNHTGSQCICEAKDILKIGI